MAKKLTKNEWIERANIIHNNKYDYSLFEYTNSQSKVTIICPEHGEFYQIANSHLQGSGCKQCGEIKCAKSNTRSTKWFIDKSKLIHGDKYNYDKTDYIKNNKKIIITCPVHGDFEQTPNSHLNGTGCSKCSNKYSYTTKEWIEKAKLVHNNIYSYENVNYINANTKVNITCLIHGSFLQKPSDHINTIQGCPYCANNINLTTEQFISKANIIHYNKYDYSNVNYTNSKNAIDIICPIHGKFTQVASCHLQGQGCPICKSSKGELLIHNWLKENNIPFKPQYKIKTDENKFIADFYLQINNTEYIIEYNGIQHYEFNNFLHKNDLNNFNKQILRDKALSDYCLNNNIKLIYFKYTLNNNELINILNNGI